MTEPPATAVFVVAEIPEESEKVSVHVVVAMGVKVRTVNVESWSIAKVPVVV